MNFGCDARLTPHFPVTKIVPRIHEIEEKNNSGPAGRNSLSLTSRSKTYTSFLRSFSKYPNLLTTSHWNFKDVAEH